MNASSPQPMSAEPFHDYDDGFEEVLPARSRARYLTPLTALLMALILGGVGFYVGIRVEKSKTTAGGGTSAFARAFSGAAGTSASTSHTSAFSGSGGYASHFGGAFGGAGGATTGSVTAVDGNTLYVKETDGNTVKVKLSSATAITKSETVSKKKIFPGDEIVVSGSTGSGGTVAATSVSDSGAAGTSAGSGSATTSGGAGKSSSAGNSSAVSSLFGGS